MLKRKLDFIIRGGLTKRYHTVDTLREQNVAEHTFFAAMLAGLIYPEDLSLVGYILMHDIAEGSVGDVASPVKRKYPGLKEILDTAESDAKIEAGFGLGSMDSRTKRRLKVCDYLEGLLFCSREIKAGNLSIDVLEAYHNFCSYVCALKPEGLELELINIILERTPSWVKSTNSK